MNEAATIVRNYLIKNGYSYKDKEDCVYKTVGFTLVYSYNNAFDEIRHGWIHIYAKKRANGKYMLVIEEVNSDCRHLIVCAYGQTFCTTSGYSTGHSEELDESDLVPMIEKNLKKYCIKKICDD